MEEGASGHTSRNRFVVPPSGGIFWTPRFRLKAVLRTVEPRDTMYLMQTPGLFDDPKEESRSSHRDAPLADRMRPRTLDEFAGQQHLLGEGKLLRRLIEEDRVTSMIFWGPPGTGKTTLARIIAAHTSVNFVPFSAVTSGIKEIRQVMTDADRMKRYSGKRTLLFIDEIHRFNKAQQDAFLPYVENGTIILIGATTENPSFEVNSALLSRVKVLVLEPLSEEDIVSIISRALTDSERGLGASRATLEEGVAEELAALTGGDARAALNTLELAVTSSK